MSKQLNNNTTRLDEFLQTQSQRNILALTPGSGCEPPSPDADYAELVDFAKSLEKEIVELRENLNLTTKILNQHILYANFPPRESFVDSDGFTWKFCLTCEVPYVVCGECGNNTCSGGTQNNCGCEEAYNQFDKNKGNYTWKDFISESDKKNFERSLFSIFECRDIDWSDTDK